MFNKNNELKKSVVINIREWNLKERSIQGQKGL